MACDILTQKRLRELLDYQPDTGKFTWLVKRGNKSAGAPAGCFDADGYKVIRVDTRMYKAHRLAWLYVHGVMPTLNIDHINRDKADNRIANLRECNQSENMQNVADASTRSGCRGVTWYARDQKWIVRLRLNYKVIRVGRFKNLSDAIAARKKAEQQYHPFKEVK